MCRYKERLKFKVETFSVEERCDPEQKVTECYMTVLMLSFAPLNKIAEYNIAMQQLSMYAKCGHFLY